MLPFYVYRTGIMPERTSKTEILPLLALKGSVVLPTTRMNVDIGREKSLSAIRSCGENGRVFVSCQKDETEENITADNIYKTGCVAEISDIKPISMSAMRATIQVLYRARMRSCEDMGDIIMAQVIRAPYKVVDEDLDEAYYRTVQAALEDVSSVSLKLNKEVCKKLLSIKDREKFLFTTASKLELPWGKLQELLEAGTISDAFALLNEHIHSEFTINKLQKKIAASVKASMDKNQREYYLREQLKAIHTELGDDEDEKQRLEDEIKAKGMPKDTEEKCLKDLLHMSKMPTTSADYNVIRSYLDTILELPWGVYTEDTQKLEDCEKILNDDHYGLEKIKERITEYLAVMKLTGGLNAPILCLVGPPGTGKTSIAESVARALGRKFVRMSLGGVRDETEIRGHRKTYVGAMPGRIINAMKTAGSMNPVFLLDEVDKLSSDALHGDPSSALLEVLDPAQNCTFRDTYLEVPFDLSKVLFITTANSLDTIPRPLKDRMEIITLEGYTQEEKIEIGKRFLVSKCMKKNGLSEGDILIGDDTISEIISGYTMEAGVRSLERQIDAICRKVAVKKAEKELYEVSVKPEELDKYLGVRHYDRDKLSQTDEIGAATGLAGTAVGGTTLSIEVFAMHG